MAIAPPAGLDMGLYDLDYGCLPGTLSREHAFKATLHTNINTACMAIGRQLAY